MLTEKSRSWAQKKRYSLPGMLVSRCATVDRKLASALELLEQECQAVLDKTSADATADILQLIPEVILMAEGASWLHQWPMS